MDESRIEPHVGKGEFRPGEIGIPAGVRQIVVAMEELCIIGGFPRCMLVRCDMNSTVSPAR